MSAILWWEQVNFQWNDDDIRFVLDQHTEVDLYSARSLKQQSAGRHVAPLGHIILIDDDIRFVLDQHTEVDLYSARSLKQQSGLDKSLHSDTLFWFRANQSLLFLLNNT